MRHHIRVLGTIVVAALALGGCADHDDGSGEPDTQPVDSLQEDVETVDSLTSIDTAASDTDAPLTSDTAEPADGLSATDAADTIVDADSDMSATDTSEPGLPDTAATDTATTDTGTSDTGSADTELHDTGSADTATTHDSTSEDTVSDTGPADIAPDIGDTVAADTLMPDTFMPDTTPPPWPPEELDAPPDPQPSGDGWRTAQYNLCTTRMDGGRLECRARISPQDDGRTAAVLERAALAKSLNDDPNFYSVTLQEVCEQDARWIAAFLANDGPPAAGWPEPFSAAENALIDDHAPYAFLPYLTHEMTGTDDKGCGPGISTGFAAIARRIPGSTGFKLRGLTNATYATREATGMTRAQLEQPEVCNAYFEYQTTYGPTNSQTQQNVAIDDFRSSGCTSTVPDTLRGLACVRSRWLAPGDSSSKRVSTCAVHAVHKGLATWRVRNEQIHAAGTELADFAGSTGQRSILSGDFNVVANRGASATLATAEQGHETILSNVAEPMTKVTVGDHVGTTRTGTLRVSPSNLECGREIDAIYVRNAWSLLSQAPNPTLCRDYPAQEPTTDVPGINPLEWSDHEMMVSPLMAPSGPL